MWRGSDEKLVCVREQVSLYRLEWQLPCRFNKGCLSSSHTLAIVEVKMRCLLLFLVFVLWACKDSGDSQCFGDKGLVACDSEPMVLPLDDQIKGEYFFDYEHPVFFTEECRFNEKSDALKCGLIAVGVRTDADTCCSQVDFSKVMVMWQNGKKENILSFATIEKVQPSVFKGIENERITTFSSMVFKDELDSLKIKNELLESDSVGIVEFEIIDGSGKRIHVNYQMEMIYLKKFISLRKEGVAFRKNHNFNVMENQCLSARDTEDDSLFFPYTLLHQCALQCDSCDMVLPVAKQSANFCGRFNFDKSFVLEKSFAGVVVDTLPFSRKFVNVYGYNRAILYYEGEERR